jgi:hypothetical protein
MTWRWAPAAAAVFAALAYGDSIAVGTLRCEVADAGVVRPRFGKRPRILAVTGGVPPVLNPASRGFV